MKKIYSVETYIEINSHYTEALSILREIITSTELEETIKWSMPTYCLKGKNVLGLGAFKNHFCLWFHHGVFLKDEHHLLINAQENKTKALRQMRFTSKDDINQAVVLAYVKEAIKNQHLGKTITSNRQSKTFIIPQELKSAFKSDVELKTCFEALTPGRQNEYSVYISEAKREATKQSRLDKIIPMILLGVGLNDSYKNS